MPYRENGEETQIFETKQNKSQQNKRTNKRSPPQLQIMSMLHNIKSELEPFRKKKKIVNQNAINVVEYIEKAADDN